MPLTYRDILRLGTSTNPQTGEEKQRRDRVCVACGYEFPLENEDCFEHCYFEFQADSQRSLGGVWWCKTCVAKRNGFPLVLVKAMKALDRDYTLDKSTRTLWYFGVLLGVWDHNNHAPAGSAIAQEVRRS